MTDASTSTGHGEGRMILVGSAGRLVSDRSQLEVCPCGIQPYHYLVDHDEVTERKAES